jgi:hypothetical protein
VAEEQAARLAQLQREQEARELRDRQRQEEDLTNSAIPRLTRPCPGCHLRIEKNGGW